MMNVMPTFSIELLTLLNDGQLHSGEEIGQVLAVSRAAVWKQIQKLQAMGFDIEPQKGLGYRLQGSFDLLNVEVINANLRDDNPIKIQHEIVVDSTSMLMQRMVQDGSAVNKLCLTAESQTHGRGRRGNTWASPFAQNLYFSLLWRFDQGLAAIEGLSLVVGMSLVETLRKQGAKAELKWPNDILLQGKKLGGILIDVIGETNGPCFVTIGVGLNVHMEKSKDGISQAWTSLQKEQVMLNRSTLLAHLLNDLAPNIEHFAKEGFSAYSERWPEFDAYCNKEVMLLLGDAVILGQALGINRRGEIRIHTAMGEKSFASGEVSLRAV